MPTATAYHRAPLVNPAYVPLSDSAMHSDGLIEALTRKLLPMVDLSRMSPLDAVLATKLGGYTEAPAMPDVDAAASLLPENCPKFLQTLLAGLMIASMTHNKQAMLKVLDGARAFADIVPTLSEEALFTCGADALRLALGLYRRTGQAFLLELMEALRSRLPDVSGVMHTFPFQREYQQDAPAGTREEEEYRARMRRMADGRYTADALSMTALLAQYSGSGRDAAAPHAGMTALNRFHGMPCGAFSADPYLAGRDPARAVELPALCAQIEAYFDALCLSGEPAFAEKMERLLVNALPDMLCEGGVRVLQSTNRFANDESCVPRAPEVGEVSALLRALYALRRSVWLSKDDDTLAYMLPVAGGCLTRVGGVPIRFIATVSGGADQNAVIRVECAKPVRMNLLVRIPSYADKAEVSVNTGKWQTAPLGTFFRITREYQNGDTVAMRFSFSPRLESGYRGSVSVYLGTELMALPLPDVRADWRYALATTVPMEIDDSGTGTQVLTTACEAPAWKERNGFVLPPPQGVRMGEEYQLTLIPYAGTAGRIAAFPTAVPEA